MIRSAEILSVALGGAIGASARFIVSRFCELHLSAITFPLGTFFVNITGCFLIGAIAGLSTRFSLSDEARLLLVTGILGGFTTFSAFGLETVVLLRAQHLVASLMYAIGSVVVGCVAVILGLYLTGFRGPIQ